MSANVIHPDFTARRRLRSFINEPATQPAETMREQWARNAFEAVIQRCDRLGIPPPNAVVHAQTCRNSVLAGHEASKAVARAVDRAWRSAFPDNPPPSAA